MYLYYSKLDYRKIKKKNIVNKYNLNFSTAIFIVMNHVMQIKLLSHQSCDVIVFIFEKLFIKCFTASSKWAGGSFYTIRRLISHNIEYSFFILSSLLSLLLYYRQGQANAVFHTVDDLCQLVKSCDPSKHLHLFLINVNINIL